MGKVLKINSPTFSGHFNFFTSSLFFSLNRKSFVTLKKIRHAFCVVNEK